MGFRNDSMDSEEYTLVSDTDAAGEIEKETQRQSSAAEKLFKVMDQDGNGFLTKKEISQCIRKARAENGELMQVSLFF